MAVIATYGLRGHEVWQRISQRGALLIATEEGAWTPPGRPARRRLQGLRRTERCA